MENVRESGDGRTWMHMAFADEVKDISEHAWWEAGKIRRVCDRWKVAGKRLVKELVGKGCALWICCDMAVICRGRETPSARMRKVGRRDWTKEEKILLIVFLVVYDGMAGTATGESMDCR